MSSRTATWIARRLRASRGDDGFAMVTVLGMAVVMTLLLTAAMAYAANGGRGTGTAANNASKAYNAAVAGVNDYVARLNANPVYCTSTDTSNQALTGWQKLEGTAGASYRYEVTSDCSIATGDSSNVDVKVTGIAGPKSGSVQPEVRTLSAKIKRPGFKDYVFFTDKEQGDPALPEYNLSTSTQEGCRKYNYSLTSTTMPQRGNSCRDLGFGTGDVLNGKVHSNDVIEINGNATFTSAVTSGCPGARTTDACYTKKFINSGGTPTWGEGPPRTGVTLSFPATDASVEAAAAAGGCIYQGPTRVVANANGTISVASPNTTPTPACPLGNNVSAPANGVVYVKDIPSSSPKWRSSCPTPWVTGASGPSANTAGSSYPHAEDYAVTLGHISCNDGNLWLEGVTNGVFDFGAKNNVYITGDLKYAGGLEGASADDATGIVAQNNIFFYHPFGKRITRPAAAAYCQRFGSPTTETETRCKNDRRNSAGQLYSRGSTTGYQYGTWVPAVTEQSTVGELCPSPCGQNLRVDAAMLSISHTITVPYYSSSGTRDMGTLTINGSVAQYYRGPVRQTVSGAYRGYTKSYNYDKRLLNIVIPGFPQITSAFGSSGFTELAPAFNGPCYGGYRTGPGC